MTKPDRQLQATSGGLSVLTYHHFAKEDGPGTRHLGITTTPARLAAQLDYVSRTYNVISLDDLLCGRVPDRSLLITIDDSYKSVHDVAAPIFAERELPAVLFTNPRPIIEAYVPTDIVTSLLGGSAAKEVVHEAIRDTADSELAETDLNALPAQHRERAKTRLITKLGSTEAELHKKLGLFLTAVDLRALPNFGIEVANHTLSHSLCRALSPAERDIEIAEAKVAIEDLTGKSVRAFAFPWGQIADATPAVLEAVRNSGHQATFLMQGLTNSKRPAPDIWYRCLATNQTPTGLALALSIKPRLRALWRGYPELPQGLP